MRKSIAKHLFAAVLSAGLVISLGGTLMAVGPADYHSFPCTHKSPQQLQTILNDILPNDDEKTHKTPEICGRREIVMEKGVAELIVSVPDKKNDVPFVLEIQLSPTMVAPPHAVGFISCLPS